MKNRSDGNEMFRDLQGIDRSKLSADGGPDFNRLIFSASPYLLQHAENPVDWYPWGDDAFARAAAEDKPVFLSIGYATCHWCHVMAHESFEDRDVAAVMKRYFVSIKVDREERPDIDEQYMTVPQLMTGSGGWPLNVFLTPDKLPFMTVTYLPKTQRTGMPGFVGLLENIASLWRSRRDRIETNCAAVMVSLRQTAVPVSGPTGEINVTESAFRQLEAMYDQTWGGFGGAPKFPMPTYLSFLLRVWKRTGNPRPLAMVGHSLRQIRCGGIYDQIGFGIHRYSVDMHWLTPHFEKMLYDQALMATVYIEAFRAAGDPLFMTVAEEIFSFVRTELTSPEGGFYTALDADSEGEEGKFYVWTPEEIRNILGAQDGEIFCNLFDVTPEGNFEGMNILNLPLPPEKFASRYGIDPALLSADMECWRELLLAGRNRRVRPLRDEKVLTAWNGLMITALAEGYAVTGDRRYRVAAEKAVDFLEQRLTSSTGRIMRSFHSDRADVPGFLEDYAFFVQGLLALYEATLDDRRLEAALRLSREMLSLFRDDESGGLFATGSDAEVVLVRGLDGSDNVMPAANSVAAGNLVRLGRIVGDEGLVAAGKDIVQAFMGTAGRQPARYLQLLTATELLDASPVEITLAGNRKAPELSDMLRAIGRRFIPDLVLRYEEGGGILHEARVCTKRACRPPVSDAMALGRLLDETG